MVRIFLYFNGTLSKKPAMLKNYFLVALRNFWRNKVFSSINILGLSIGISASLVIFLLVWHDLNFDRFEPNRDRIYRVVGQNTENGKLGYMSVVPVPLAEVIQKEIAGIELVAPIHTMDPHPNEDPIKVSIPYPNAAQPKILKDQNDFAATDTRRPNSSSGLPPIVRINASVSRPMASIRPCPLVRCWRWLL